MQINKKQRLLKYGKEMMLKKRVGVKGMPVRWRKCRSMVMPSVRDVARMRCPELISTMQTPASGLCKSRRLDHRGILLVSIPSKTSKADAGAALLLS